VVSDLQSTSQNLTSARSGVQDTNFAAETANLTQANILQQSGIAVLSQANSVQKNVLSLLQNL
jgi:flagellin